MADYDLQYQDTYIDALLATAKELKTAGYIYKGVATPSTNPGTPTERVAYLASEPGTYTNFGGIVIASGLYSLTYASGTWTGTQMQAGSDIEVVQTTGDSITDVMSQKAVTDEINSIKISQKVKFVTAFQIAASNSSTALYSTALNFTAGKKYKIRLRASASYSNSTAFILQTAYNTAAGQKVLFSIPSGSKSAEYDYDCADALLKYVAIYSSGAHTITYNVAIYEYLEEAWDSSKHGITYVDYFLSLTNFKVAQGNSTNSICINVHEGEKLYIHANNTRQCQYALLTSLPTLSQNQDISSYIVSSNIMSADTDTEIIIPKNVTIIWINISTYYSNRLLNYSPSSYRIENGNLYGLIKNDNYIEVSTTIANGRFVERNLYLSPNNKRFAATANTKGKYLNVKAGECYRICADKGHETQIATLKSIANVVADYDVADAIRTFRVPSGQEVFIRIDEGETILWMNLQTVSGGVTYSFDGSIYDAVEKPRKIGGSPILLLPIYGQSLAIGGDTTRLTTKPQFPTITFNTESIYNVFSDNVETSKEGLLDSLVENYCKETIISYADVASTIVSFSSGTGSTSITGLKKGTTNYNNLLSKIQQAFGLSNGNLVVPAFCWVQGEEDRFDTHTSDYKGELTQLRADLDADIKAITGQTQDVHCIVYQTNQLSIGGSHYLPNNYQSGDYGALMSVPQAQYELIRDNAYFHASTPIYMMSYYISSNGYAIHITNESQRLLGYYEGLQAQRMLSGGADIGLYVTSVEKIDNTHIKVNIHTPCPPLVIDTEQVYEVAGYGFSVITSNNENILQSVTIAPNHYSEQSIIIETSADCTNAKVRYGVNGTIAINSSGFKQGSRGNIRDSQGLEYMANINGKKVPMHNWLYFFEEIVS